MADLTSEQLETNSGDGNAQSDKPIIRILLADSQAIYRVGMRKVFALEDDIRVVGQVERMEQLYETIERHPADVLLMEGSLIAGTSDTIPEVVRIAPDLKIIVQTSGTD